MSAQVCFENVILVSLNTSHLHKKWKQSGKSVNNLMCHLPINSEANPKNKGKYCADETTKVKNCKIICKTANTKTFKNYRSRNCIQRNWDIFVPKIQNSFLWDENHLSTYFLSRLHLPNLHCHVIKQWFETRCEPNYCYSWFLSCHIKYHLILIFLWIDSVTIIRVGIDVEADFSWNVSSSSVPNQSIL